MKITPLTIIISVIYANLFSIRADGQSSATYATRLGWKANERVVIFHVDDAGMSYESNQGTIQALEYGIATSCSVMMPCPWVPDFTNYLRKHPLVDAGLHLTHTSEWNAYRWGSLAGAATAPGLADEQGYLWNNVTDVLHHAPAAQVETEIRMQLRKAKTFGFSPTHLDTHMGTMWASPEYLRLFQRISLEEHIPILIPAGHNTLLFQQIDAGPLSGLKKLVPDGDKVKIGTALRLVGDTLWNGGLAVVDDLYILSYDWALPSGMDPSDENIRKFKTEKYKRLLSMIKPGITVILIHCTDARESFNMISDSGVTRRGDLLSMTNPELKYFILKQKVVLTTWRELQQRREQLRKQ